jgi:hypothetical protein
VIMISTKGETSGVCHFLRVPLEIRDSIYRLLLTTSSCTSLKKSGRSFHLTIRGIYLKFQFCTSIIRANKQVSVEATRVLWEENAFVILKFVGMNLNLSEVPAFKHLTEDKVRNPVLRAEIRCVPSTQYGYYYSGQTGTIITTAEGIQPIISTLWKLKRNSTHVIMTPPSEWSISLDFKVEASLRREVLGNVVLKPWGKLHGIKELALTGDIGDSMHRNLQQGMLEGPFSTEAAMNLREYYLLGEKEMIQKNHRAAEWFWALFEGYWRHLRKLIEGDTPKSHEMKDTNNQLWNSLWIESNRMFLEENFELMKTYLHQLKYEEVVWGVRKVLYECHWSPSPNYTIKSPVLNAKFFLGDALANIALGEIRRGSGSLTSAARSIFSSGLYSNKNGSNSSILEDISELLQKAIDTELTKLNSPYRCAQRAVGRSRPWDWHVESKRSFWEWLDLPEA